MGQIRQLRIADKLIPLFAANTRYKLAYGGRGSGKSWGFAAYLLASGQRRPLKIACMRETMASIRDSSHSLLQGWIERIPEFAASYEVEKQRIIGRNGTEIIFKGLKEEGAHRIKSLEGVDLCWIDEAQAVSTHSWEMLLPTIRKDGAEILSSWNPYLANDPVWVELVEKRAELSTIVQLNYTDNPWLSDAVKQEAELCRINYPEDYRHIWLGEPVSSDEAQFIQSALVDAAKARSVTPSGPIVFGLDVARFGNDSSVLVARQGGKVIHWQQWRKLSPLDVSEQVADLVVRYGPVAVVVDSVGLGSGAVDPLRRICGAATEVVEYNGGYLADNALYDYQRSQSWGDMRDWLSSGSIPADREFVDSLLVPRYHYTSKNKISLETKKRMKSRGKGSPDIGDALSMTFFGKYAKNKEKAVSKPVAVSEWF